MRRITYNQLRGLFSILLHPIDGYEQTRFRMHGSMELATVLYILYFAATVCQRQFIGFIFNNSRVDRLNIFIMAAFAFGLPFLWIVSNMAVCTLTNGEGSLKDIYVVTAYALLPYVLLSPVLIALSNFFVAKESAYVALIELLQVAWTGVLILTGNMVAHQYTFMKTLITAAATIIGIAIILFLLFLAFNLVQQLFGFIQTIVNEITFMST